MADDFTLYNFGNVFLAYIHQRDCRCTFNVYDHNLVYVRSGELEINDNGQSTHLHAGDCVFIRKDVRIKLNKYCLDDGLPYQSIGLVFSREFLLNYFKQLPPEELPRHAQRSEQNLLLMPARPDIESLFQSITPYFESKEQPDQAWANRKLQEGLQALLKTDENVYASLFDFADPWKIDILNFLNKHYMYDLTLAEIANFTGRSLSTFKRDFKKVSDLTPEKWLIQRRLQAADRLLVETDEPIKEIMYRVGFNNFSFFCRVYRQHYGCTPTVTRQTKHRE